MPALHYWFTGGALAAFLTVIATLSTLTFAWYRAAVTEMELAVSKAEASAKTAKTEKVKELLGKALISGNRAIAGLTNDTSQAESVFQKWARPVHDLIVAAYGPGEGHLLLDDSGLKFLGGSRVGNMIRGRQHE